jgi:tetratricopeptide (TPR) repeat protein
MCGAWRLQKSRKLPSANMKIVSPLKRETRASRTFVSFAFGAICFFGAGAAAARPLPQHEGHEAASHVPSEILERPVPLRQGIGKVHEEVTTSSPQAQAFYDQGLAYLHSFVWIEAARSFHQALRSDSSLAMAYLGLSDAYVGLQEFPEAVEAFQKAQSFAKKLTDRERSRLTIRARQLDYLRDSGNLQKYFAYRQSVADALAANPQDPWLWVLRGFADEGSPLAHGQGGAVDTIAFYEMALKFSPDSFVAHHYLAHTLENHGPVKQALEETQNYERMAPAIPHAHHMVGHNLRRLGRTEEAIQEFLKAEELENAYYRAENIPAQYDWHHAHNLQLLGLCYQSLGQMKAAEAALREAFAQPGPIDFAEFNRRAWPEFLLDRDRPQEALEAAQSMIENSNFAMGRFAGQTLAGQAFLAMNCLEDARNSLSMAEQEMEHVPAAVIKSLPDAGLLRAEIMLHEKNWNKGNALLEKLEEEIVAVPGPDAWSEALFQLECIAKVARQVGDWELAGSTARKMIEHDPSYAGGYFALALVAENQGDGPTARQELATAEKLWSKADADVRPSQAQKP